MSRIAEPQARPKPATDLRGQTYTEERCCDAESSREARALGYADTYTLTLCSAHHCPVEPPAECEQCLESWKRCESHPEQLLDDDGCCQMCEPPAPIDWTPDSALAAHLQIEATDRELTRLIALITDKLPDDGTFDHASMKTLTYALVAVREFERRVMGGCVPAGGAR